MTTAATRLINLTLMLQHLRTCRPKDVPQHAEKTLPAVTTENSNRSVGL